MRFRRPHGPADRAETERLLDAARGGETPARAADRLTHLLAEAAAEARPSELSGEERALAAFRTARATPTPVPARAPARPRLRVGMAAWLAGLAATATAGVAFAAVGLNRPDVPAPPPAPTTTGGIGTSNSPSSASTGSGTPTDVGPSATASPSTDATGDPGGASRGRLGGLCTAYLAKSADQRARALETPSFGRLVDAAGGADRVEGYCVALVPEPSATGKGVPSATGNGGGPSATGNGGGPSATGNGGGPSATVPRHTKKPTKKDLTGG